MGSIATPFNYNLSIVTKYLIIEIFIVWKDKEIFDDFKGVIIPLLSLIKT